MQINPLMDYFSTFFCIHLRFKFFRVVPPVIFRAESGLFSTLSFPAEDIPQNIPS
jgi:hypothetical protein